MDIQLKKLSTSEEYTDFVREYVTLVDEQLTKWEGDANNPQKLSSLIERMPVIISLVNTLGYLRGQDNVFLDFRPHTPDNQPELYQYENEFEKRLQKLIEIIKESKYYEQYKSKLEEYFIKVRT